MTSSAGKKVCATHETAHPADEACPYCEEAENNSATDGDIRLARAALERMYGSYEVPLDAWHRLVGHAPED